MRIAALLAFALVAPPALAADTHRRIDAALQAAYDRGARANELAPLWQKRNRALRDVIAQYRSAGPGDALAVTRI